MTWRIDEPFECQVCGRPGARVTPVLIGIPPADVMYRVACTDCRAHGPLCNTPEGAVIRWCRGGLESVRWETYEGRKR